MLWACLISILHGLMAGLPEKGNPTSTRAGLDFLNHNDLLLIRPRFQWHYPLEGWSGKIHSGAPGCSLWNPSLIKDDWFSKPKNERGFKLPNSRQSRQILTCLPAGHSTVKRRSSFATILLNWHLTKLPSSCYARIRLLRNFWLNLIYV